MRNNLKISVQTKKKEKLFKKLRSAIEEKMNMSMCLGNDKTDADLDTF